MMENTETKTVSQPMWTMFHVVAMLSGIAIQLNWLAHTASPGRFNRGMMLAQVLVGAAIFTVVLSVLRWVLHWMLANSIMPQELKDRYPRHDGWAYTPLLLTFFGAIGLTFTWHIIALIIFLCIAANVLLVFILKQKTMAHALGSKEWLGFLFLLSGVAALMYQIIWQRILFTMYGVNIESVTVIVSIFMFGLGIGSIAGGFVSEKFTEKLPTLFFVCEVVIGAFGVISIPLIKYVGLHTQHLTLFQISLVTFALLCIPTMMMGATLPILVTHINKQYKHVGKSVGILYFFNTIGSAVACFLTVEFFFVVAGLQTTTIIAAFFNLTVGILVFRYMTQHHILEEEEAAERKRIAKAEKQQKSDEAAAKKAAARAAKAEGSASNDTGQKRQGKEKKKQDKGQNKAKKKRKNKR